MINNSENLKLSTSLVQISTILLILLAYLTSRYLMIVAAAICCLFLLSNVGWEQKYALLFFVFPFCSIFTMKSGQSSIFMVLRVAIIISALFYDRKKINTRLVTLCMTLLFYMTVISLGSISEGAKKIINVILWYIIAYLMVSTIDNEKLLPITRSFSTGTIISCVLGMNLSYFPELQEELMHVQHMGYAGEFYTRFTGIFNDPNIFTAIICFSMCTVYYEFARKKINMLEFSIRTILSTFFGLLSISKSAVILIVIYWAYIIFSANRIKIVPKIVITMAVFAFAMYFLIKNPYWAMNLADRFTRKKSFLSGVNINDITTGRVQIWGWYLKYMYSSNCWIFGNGVGGLTPYGRAAHNVLIQLVYTVGIVGTIIIYKAYKLLYYICPEGKKISSKNRSGWLALMFVFATMCFLDGFTNEVYHYLVPLSFIYIRNCEYIKTDDEEKDRTLLEN